MRDPGYVNEKSERACSQEFDISFSMTRTANTDKLLHRVERMRDDTLSKPSVLLQERDHPEAAERMA